MEYEADSLPEIIDVLVGTYRVNKIKFELGTIHLHVSGLSDGWNILHKTIKVTVRQDTPSFLWLGPKDLVYHCIVYYRTVEGKRKVEEVVNLVHRTGAWMPAIKSRYDEENARRFSKWP